MTRCEPCCTFAPLGVGDAMVGRKRAVITASDGVFASGMEKKALMEWTVALVHAFSTGGLGAWVSESDIDTGTRSSERGCRWLVEATQGSGVTQLAQCPGSHAVLRGEEVVAP